MNKLSRTEMKKVMGGYVSPGGGNYTGCEGQTRFECEMEVIDKIMGDDGAVPYGIAESLALNICSKCAEVRPV